VPLEAEPWPPAATGGAAGAHEDAAGQTVADQVGVEAGDPSAGLPDDGVATVVRDDGPPAAAARGDADGTTPGTARSSAPATPASDTGAFAATGDFASTGDFDARQRGGRAAADAPVRMLVRTDGDAGIVHVLGRRTTVGRTPDNDLRINAEWISRHHAVVLQTSAGTVVEDLNSTNGVMVNGLRVARRQLEPGDLVTFGKSGFRYLVKARDGEPGR
jgi:hypothetical protein